MARDLSDLVKIAARLPEELQRAQIAGVRKASLTVTKSIRAEIRSATGGDMKISGVGKRGAKVGARFDVKGKTNPVGFITARGPLQIIERDTSPHAITPNGRRLSKRYQAAVRKGKADPSKPIYLSGARALKFSDGNLRPSAMHPGTRGKHPWQKGLAKSRAGTREIFAEEIHKAVVRAVR